MIEARFVTPVLLSCLQKMSMLPPRFPVAVIVQRTPLANRWVSERCEPVAVEVDTDDRVATTPERIAADANIARWRFSGYAMELHRSEAEGYFLNITSPSPKVFVMWRRTDDGADPPVRPEVVTVSYNEAARLLDGGEQVEGLPMLPEVLAWMTPFVDSNYKPEPKRKVRRNDPFAKEGLPGDRSR